MRQPESQKTRKNLALQSIGTRHSGTRPCRYIAQLARLALLFCLSSQCSAQQSAAITEPLKHAPTFSITDWLCASPGSNCRADEREKLFSQPPSALVEVNLGGNKLHIPAGYIDPIMAMYPAEDALYLNAFSHHITPRTPQNISEFNRSGPHPGLIRFSVILPGKAGRYSAQDINNFADKEKYRRLDTLDHPKRYADQHGLAHWGNHYKLNPKIKPCEVENEASPCGTYSQDDFYIPLWANGTPSTMSCAAWPNLKASTATKALAMTQAQRDAYFDSGQQADERAASPWRMRVEPRCRHHMLYTPLNARVRITYNLALLPYWNQIENGVRQVLDKALAQATRPPAAESVPVVRFQFPPQPASAETEDMATDGHTENDIEILDRYATRGETLAYWNYLNMVHLRHEEEPNPHAEIAMQVSSKSTPEGVLISHYVAGAADHANLGMTAQTWEELDIERMKADLDARKTYFEEGRTTRALRLPVIEIFDSHIEASENILGTKPRARPSKNTAMRQDTVSPYAQRLTKRSVRVSN